MQIPNISQPQMGVIDLYFRALVAFKMTVSRHYDLNIFELTKSFKNKFPLKIPSKKRYLTYISLILCKCL